jgi:hypothetical protein
MLSGAPAFLQESECSGRAIAITLCQVVRRVELVCPIWTYTSALNSTGFGGTQNFPLIKNASLLRYREAQLSGGVAVRFRLKFSDDL